MPDAIERLEVLFGEALTKEGKDREEFLARACAADTALQTHVRRLLRVYSSAGNFLEPAPPAEFAGIPPATRIGRYRILEKIGEGGIGEVFRAEQEEPVRRQVALKVIKPGMDTREVIARFESERQALALMNHPHIARVFDAGATETGRPYFVMELVRGLPITTFCDEHKLVTSARVELFMRVCHAIQHAHQKGVIHRDIKPSNILVAPGDGGPEPKVIDFGIAKATGFKLTEKTLATAFAHFIGTPSYMSPEQADASGLDVDTRSDIYSLGVLLYELLTGGTPFNARELAQAGLEGVRKRIRETEPPKPSTRLRTLAAADRATVARLRGTAPTQLSILIRGDLDWIVMRCLEKDRTRRYETANGLAMDLQRHLQHEPIAARPPSATYVLQKLGRRHRVAFAAAAVVAAVFIAAAAVSTWQAVRATRAEDEQARLRGVEAQLRRRAEADELAARRKAYAADMKLVQQALASENLGRALALFNRHRPQAGQADLRGWEWRYLWQRCQSEAQAILISKNGAISTLANSPDLVRSHDGKWLAVGSSDGTVSVLNLGTGQAVRVPGRAQRTAFSPHEAILATTVGGGLTTRLLLWDPASGQSLREFSLGHPVGTVLFSPDGESIVTLADQIERWRVADGKRLAAFPIDVKQGGGWAILALSPDGRLAVYRADDSVRVIDLATGEERWRAKAASEFVIAVAFSPDGKVVVTGPGMVESTIRMWDADSGREIGRLEGHAGYVGTFAFWPDGKTLASAGGDQTIRLWDVENRRLIRTLHGHTSEVRRLVLLADGRTLISSSKDGEVFRWDTAGEERGSGRYEIPKTIGAWQFAADSQSILTVDPAGEVERWRGAGFQEEESLMSIGSYFFKTDGNLGGFVYGRSVKFSVDRPWLAVGSLEGVVKVWDWERRILVRQLKISDRTVFPVGFVDHGGKLLVTESTEAVGGGTGQNGNHQLYEWDLVTGEMTRSWPGLPVAASSKVFGVISPDERWCALFGYSGGVSLVDLVSGQVVHHKIDIRSTSAQGFASDGRKVIASSWHGYARLWEIPSFREFGTLTDFPRDTHSAIFSPDGRRIATGTDATEAIRLWDADSFENVLNLPAAGTAFWQTAFSPDGNVLGSANVRGNLYLWRAPSWADITAAELRQEFPQDSASRR